MPLQNYVGMIEKFDPLAIDQQVAENRALQQRNRLADFAFEQHQRELEEGRRMNEIYRNSIGQDGKLDRNALESGIVQGGMGSKLMAIRKQFAEQDKLAAETGEKAANTKKHLADVDKEQLALKLKNIEIAAQIMGPVKDQATWDVARQQTIDTFGPEAGMKMPEQYNPVLIEQKRKQGMAIKDQLEQDWKQKGYDLDVAKFDYQQKNDAANRDVTMRGQDFVDARARDRLEFDKGNSASDAGGPSQSALVKRFGKAPAGYRYKDDGTMEAIPGGPADAKAKAQEQRLAEGATDVDVAISTLRDAYDRLEKGGGITSTDKGPLENITAAASSSAIGQGVGKMLGTSNQSARNEIAMARPALLAALMKATGMSAKQMDSNAELKLWLATATDPTLDVQANRKALANIEKKYLRGEKESPNDVQPKRVTSDADYNALPSGAEFIDPNGKRRRKP